MIVHRRHIYHKRDRLKQLRAFCYTARLGSLTEAALRLGVTQPAVSVQVRQLEYELQATLFQRTSKGSRLTRAGETVFEMVEPLVRGMDKLSAGFLGSADNSAHGQLRIAAASDSGATFVLPSLVRQFRDCYPGVRLRVTSCPLAEGRRLLLRKEVECVVGKNGPYPKDKLQYHHLLTYDLVVITSPKHPLVGRDTVSPEEVAKWPSIAPLVGTYSRQYGETAVERLGMDVKTMIRVHDWEVIKCYVEYDLGIAVVPGFCVSRRDRVAVIPLMQDSRSRSFGVFTRRESDLSVLAWRLLCFLVPNFPESSGRVPPLEA